MRDFTLSTTGHEDHSALDYGYRLAAALPNPPRRVPLLLDGHGAPLAAACAWALAERHVIVLPPAQQQASIPGRRLFADPSGLRTADEVLPATEPVTWDAALYTSGSTGIPRGFGFTRAQLDQLAAWYTAIYAVTKDSAIVTALPVGYNFTFVAGLYLAATIGARLHLAADPAAVFRDAAALAAQHDQCVVLANPIVLQQPPQQRLPGNVLIDSGGAPLSITAIGIYRNDVADLREGYGLTETGSLTHFDTAADMGSLGTVGRPMSGVTTSLDPATQTLTIASPAIGQPLNSGGPNRPPRICRTSDVGRIDAAGRLRLLGRADDHPVGGLWPRDLLDILGPVLRTRCAAVYHPAPDRIRIRLAATADPVLADRLRAAASAATGIARTQVHVDSPDQPLLASLKIPRPPASKQEVGR